MLISPVGHTIIECPRSIQCGWKLEEDNAIAPNEKGEYRCPECNQLIMKIKDE